MPPVRKQNTGSNLTRTIHSAAMEHRAQFQIDLDYTDDILLDARSKQDQSLANIQMIDIQPELEWSMRPFLLDFLVEVATGYKLQASTLHLAINIIDRYASHRIVFKKHFQLLGCSALWIAAKYEEPKERVMSVSELRLMCCDAYREEMFVQMEAHILLTLQWNISVPTIDFFLQAFWVKQSSSSGTKQTKAGEAGTLQFASQYSDLGPCLTFASSQEALCLYTARYLADIAVYQKELITTPPSIVAASCIFLARHIVYSIASYQTRKSAAINNELSPYYSAQHQFRLPVLSLEKLPKGCAESITVLQKALDSVSIILRKRYESDKFFRAAHLVESYIYIRKLAARRVNTPSQLSSPITRQCYGSEAQLLNKYSEAPINYAYREKERHLISREPSPRLVPLQLTPPPTPTEIATIFVAPKNRNLKHVPTHNRQNSNIQTSMNSRRYANEVNYNPSSSAETQNSDTTSMDSLLGTCTEYSFDDVEACNQQQQQQPLNHMRQHLICPETCRTTV